MYNVPSCGGNTAVLGYGRYDCSSIPLIPNRHSSKEGSAVTGSAWFAEAWKEYKKLQLWNGAVGTFEKDKTSFGKIFHVAKKDIIPVLIKKWQQPFRTYINFSLTGITGKKTNSKNTNMESRCEKQRKFH